MDLSDSGCTETRNFRNTIAWTFDLLSFIHIGQEV